MQPPARTSCSRSVDTWRSQARRRVTHRPMSWSTVVEPHELLAPWCVEAHVDRAGCPRQHQPMLVCDRSCVLSLPSALLEEEPAMALEIFGAVASAGRSLFDARQDRGPGCLGVREMAIEIVDVHQHAVDDPGHS